MKKPLRLLALLCCISILCSCSTTGSKKAKMTAEVQKIVAADQELHRQRNQALKDPHTRRGDAARIYTRYAQELRSMDMSRCPLDFQTAYLEYIHSVEDVSTQMSKQPPSIGLGALLSGLLGLVTGGTAGGAVLLSGMDRSDTAKSALDKATEAAMMKAQESRRKIELIALQYGVRVQEPQE